MARVDQALAARLRILAGDSGLTQTELARRAGVSRTTMNKVLLGKCRPNQKVLGALAHEFRVDVLELLGVVEREAQAQRRLEAVRERAERREREWAAKTAEHAQIQTQLDERVSRLQAEISERDRRITHLQATAKLRIAKLESHKARYRDLEVRYADEKAAHAKTTAEASERVASLEEEIAELVGDAKQSTPPPRGDFFDLDDLHRKLEEELSKPPRIDLNTLEPDLATLVPRQDPNSMLVESIAGLALGKAFRLAWDKFTS